MTDAGARAHHLDIAGLGAATIAQAVLVGNGPGPDIGDDFHIGVGMVRKAGIGGDGIVIPYSQRSPAHAARVVIVGKGKVVMGIQPAMVGGTEAGKGSDVDHVRAPCGEVSLLRRR